MKISITVLNRKLVSTIFALGFLSNMAFAGEATAFSLIKEGNDYVGKEARDKVVQIRSEKSVGTMEPVIWFIVYYDPDATFKAAEVKFGGGKKMEVKRPMRMLEYAKADKVFDEKKLKTDSDAAIKIASAEPLLKNLTLKATQLWLDFTPAGPTWKVRLWAAKLKNPNDTADIGDVYINAEDGRVVKTDLHINRVD